MPSSALRKLEQRWLMGSISAYEKRLFPSVNSARNLATLSTESGKTQWSRPRGPGRSKRDPEIPDATEEHSGLLNGARKKRGQ